MSKTLLLCRALVDQASSALLFHKFHQVSIVLVPFSSIFFLYFPAFTCADLCVIAVLQGASRILFGDTPYSSTHGWIALKQEEDEGYWSEKGTEHPDRARDEPRKLQRALRALATSTLLLASICTVAVAVLAAGMYDAGRVIFRWEEALTFESTGQTGFLLNYALENYGSFCSCWISSFIGGLALTASRLAVRRFLTQSGRTTAMRSPKLLILRHPRLACYAARGLAILFVAISISVRPSSSVPTSNLLLEGITTAAALAFSGGKVAATTQLLAPGLYGISNIRQPRVAQLPPPNKIKHVFHIFLESADGLAWPFSPEFCENRACQDIAPEYNTAEHMTPFFQSLIQGPNTYFTSKFKTSVAYTTKSHFASMCGQLPELRNFVHAEAQTDPELPCLPKIVRALDPKFASGFFIPHFFPFDGFGDTTNRTGYDLMFGKDEMYAAWVKAGVPLPEESNLFGFSETEMDPFVFAWIDEQLANDKRIFMTHAGSIMHNDWNLPPSEGKKPFQYTAKSLHTNKYLNTVKWTDNHLRIFFAGLEERGLLDSSLIVVQGDHGPRIDGTGVMNNERWVDSGIFKAPLLIRMPGLVQKGQPLQPAISLDILPTILDALGLDSKFIEQYVGHSVFRQRGPQFLRHTFHAQIPGRHWVQVTYEDKLVSYKAIVINSDVCGTDLRKDPEEKYLSCLQEGWRSINVDGKMVDGVTGGLWKAGKDQEKFIKWMEEADVLLQKHSALNREEWSATAAFNRTDNQQVFLAQVAQSKTHSK